MFCKKCGKEVSPEDDFCANCQEPVAKPVQANIGAIIASMVLAFLSPLVCWIMAGVQMDKATKTKNTTAQILCVISIILGIANFIFNVYYNTVIMPLDGEYYMTFQTALPFLQASADMLAKLKSMLG